MLGSFFPPLRSRSFAHLLGTFSAVLSGAAGACAAGGMSGRQPSDLTPIASQLADGEDPSSSRPFPESQLVTSDDSPPALDAATSNRPLDGSTLSAATLDADPTSSTDFVKYGEFFAWGRECSLQDTELASDGLTFTVRFDRYRIEAAGGQHRGGWGGCDIGIPLVERTTSYALESITTTVTTHLVATAIGSLSSTVMYDNGFAPPHADRELVVEGPAEGDFVKTETFDLAFVPCTTNRQPVIMTSADLTKAPAEGASDFRVKSIVAKFVERPCASL